ncbi:MAG: ribose-phosphate diphosphokinase [Chloroflexota bacterium]|nr:ribose-phosphate diphosphokinase [Chloroflexota bacterium]
MEKGVRIYGELALIAGSGNPELAQEISEALDVPLHDVEIKTFANENIFVQLKQTVRSKDVFIIQSTCFPVNYNVMELLIMIDAVRRASAGRITAVVPFYAYARSDKKDMPRVPITAALLASMIEVAGADRFMTVDLHAPQIQGFFNMPTDELTAFRLIREYFLQKDIPDMTVVAADLGFAKEARYFAEQLNVPVAFVEKRRTGSSTQSLTVIGDVRGRNVVLVDDEVNQGTTMAGGAKKLHEAGAQDVYACFVHPTFTEKTIRLLDEADFKEIVFTNTERVNMEALLPNMKVIHLGDWLAAVIDAVHRGFSVGETLRNYEPKFD